VSWHAETALLERYATGTIDDAQAYSVEAHLVACAQCRAAVGDLVPARRQEAIWDEIVEVLDSPHPRPIEVVLRRLGLRDHTARLLAATPSLQLSWLLAQMAVIAFAVVASRADRGPGTAIFLALAPLIPIAGIAAAFGPSVDPGYEVAAAAPMASFRLLLVRSTAVLGTAVVLTGLAASGLPHVGWTAMAWVLPALALAGATLAVGSVVSIERAALAIGGAWLIVVMGAADASNDRLAAFGGRGQVLWAAVLVVSAVAVVRRRDTFDKGARA
jgi:hypothetical protein